ncbi:MAG: preprotein translocase subunit YajC [Deferribacteraceae bacterium]|jgi:preprotein translocase subunit YajC|nr:preprotein translocase subunit YajC [Deferribacteraceae bacterium]
MFFLNSAYAQDVPPGVEGSLLHSVMGNPIILIVVFFAIFYFLMIRPQQKRQKQINETLNALKAGDRIMTTSGIYGTIDSVINEQTFMLTIASGVKIQIARVAVASKLDTNNTMTEKK